LSTAFGLQAVWNGSVANPVRFVSVPAGGDVHSALRRDREHGRDDGRGPIRLDKVATVDNDESPFWRQCSGTLLDVAPERLALGRIAMIGRRNDKQRDGWERRTRQECGNGRGNTRLFRHRGGAP
jgi:hypothetical protein